mmetsp:Transcript_56652/g.148736  ORF Transcript_56652/g.148736 Transcript_56652/m.148736 type:complete len:657 (+) Transcript_56652:92-2062(+)
MGTMRLGVLATGCALVIAAHLLGKRRRGAAPAAPTGTKAVVVYAPAKAPAKAPAAEAAKPEADGRLPAKDLEKLKKLPFMLNKDKSGNSLTGALTAQKLARRWRKKTDTTDSPFHQAMAVLVDLSAELASKKDAAGAESIERAVALLSTLRPSGSSSHESHRKSFNQMLGDMQSSEAVGIRQWVPDEEAAVDITVASPSPSPSPSEAATSKRASNSKWSDAGTDVPSTSAAAESEGGPPTPSGVGGGANGGANGEVPTTARRSEDDPALFDASDLAKKGPSTRALVGVAAAVPANLVSADEAEVLRMLEHVVNDWEFDALKLDELTGGHALQAFGWALFERHGLRDSLGFKAEMVLTFLAKVEANYRPVSYHNSAHAACVLHGLHWLLTSTTTLKGCIATPLDVFACFLAAMVHDLNHDGRNNAFHCASNSELALRYAYQSPLERHHLAMAFGILDCAECNLLAGMSGHDKRALRELVVSLVLATDFTYHKDIMDDFKAMLEMRGMMPVNDDGVGAAPNRRSSLAETLPIFTSEEKALSAEDKLLTLKVVIKMADLGNLSKGYDYTMAWTDRVLEEFYSQGDDEKAAGLPVSPGFERASASRQTRVNSQMGFIKFMVKPLYDTMDLLVLLDEPQDNLQLVCERYSVEQKAWAAEEQ